MTHEMNRFGDYDVLVVEGTIAGVAAAIEIARAGRRVALVMSGASPALEFTTAMGCVLSQEEVSSLPAELAGCFRDIDRRGLSDDLSIYTQSRLAEFIEDALLDAGVAVFYDARPGGVLVEVSDGGPATGDTSRVAGVVFGGKFGTACATTRAVIDCTADAIVARAAGAAITHRSSFPPGTRDAPMESCSLFVHTDSEHTEPDTFYPLAEGVTVRFLSNVAEVRFPHARHDLTDEATANESTDVCVAARRHRFIRDTLIEAADEWSTDHADVPFTIRRAADEILYVPVFVVGDTTGTGVETLSPAADGRVDAGAYLDNRTRYIGDVPDVVKTALSAVGTAATTRSRNVDYALRVPGAPDAGLADRELGLADPAHDDARYDRIRVSVPRLPVERAADVVICGLGTSGIEAARSAAELGLTPVCFEKHGDVGGVGTVGGVPAYWYGRRTPFFKTWHRELREEVATRGIPVAFALYDEASRAGAELNLKTPFCGVETENGRVTGVVCIGENGFFIAQAEYVVDASSDGDIAAWAGAPYTYGAERDEITLWCSFGSFVHGKYEASRQYQSVVDQRSIFDTARGMIAGRRMVGVNGPGDFVQDYLAGRESRHITGRTVVTYHDVMAGRAFPDAVLWCKSNIDIKGMASSRAVLCGFVEDSFLRNFHVSIPYSAITSKTLTNVLVIGKAYSITHDGISMARMQPDMIQLGTVAGVVLKSAATRNNGSLTDAGSLHDVDIPAIQANLTETGILSEGDVPVDPDDERLPPDSDDAMADLVDRILTYPAEPDEWARIFMYPDRALELFRSRDARVLWLRPATAHLRCALGDPTDADIILAEIDSLIADGLPGIAGHRRHDMPDHGWAPRPVQLANSLAECGELRVIPRLERIADKLWLDASVSDHRFNYAHCFSYVGERLAHPDMIPVLRRISTDTAIDGAMIQRGADPRLTKDYIGERYAYLGLCLARAAARCGDPDGYRRLIEYTGEIRLYLARSAVAELTMLTGLNYGFERARWTAWLEAGASSLKPIAYTVRHA